MENTAKGGKNRIREINKKPSVITQGKMVVQMGLTQSKW